MKTVFAASLLAVSAVAFEITAPAADATWGQTGDHVVTWTNTDSDPDFFAMYLVNNEMKVPAVVTIDANVSKSLDTYDFENVLSYNSSGFIVEFGPVGGNYSTESNLASSGSFNISPNANSVATGQPAVDTATSTGGASTPTTAGSGSESSASGTAAASGSGSASSGSSTASAAAKSGAQSQFGTRGVAITVGLVAAGITGAFALF